MFTIKRNDLKPNLQARCTEGDTPVDISQAESARVIIANRLGNKVDAAVTILDDGTEGLRGLWEYEWAEGDTDVAGDFRIEVEVTWPGGAPQTFPSGGYETVRITKDLD